MSVCGWCSFREWDRILPADHLLHEPLPIINGPVGLGFPPQARRYHPRKHPFRYRFRGIGDIWKGLGPVDGTSSFPGGAGSTNSDEYTVGGWGCGVHAVQGGIDLGDAIFVFDLFELQMFRNVSDQGIGTYPSLVVVAHEPHPISVQPEAGVGFLNRPERYRTGTSSFSSPIGWRWR